MKKIILILCALPAALNVCAQDTIEQKYLPDNNFNEARRFFLSLDSKNVNKRNLMSSQALNIFMAKKVNAYLSGSGDLSLYKSYFIVDPTDGSLFIGYNLAKDPGEGSQRTKIIYNLGFKSNIADAFSTVYSGEDKKISSDLGFNFKITRLGRGIISYSNTFQRQIRLMNFYGVDISGFTQAEIAKFERMRLRNEMSAAMAKDSTEYISSLNGITPSYRLKKGIDFYKKKNQEYKEEYITKEADYISGEENYDWYWSHWASLNVFIPFTNSEYKVAPDFTGNIENKFIYSFDGSILYNNILETKKTKWFVNLSFGVKNLNNIKTEQIEKYAFNDYKKRVTTDTSTLNLTQVQSTDVFIGKYISEYTSYFSCQVVSLFLASKTIGLSFMVEKYMGNYHPLNVKLGLPFALKGKDDETKANFEIQFKVNDFNNEVYPDKSISEKFIIGLSVGIPLTSKIY